MLVSQEFGQQVLPEQEGPVFLRGQEALWSDAGSPCPHPHLMEDLPKDLSGAFFKMHGE